MSELIFKGKEFVYNHHLAVPFRPLVPDAAKSVGEPKLDGNLVIHGDNLHALKALLPMYAGKVDCIFIDPPYNTGNEGWSYNDNVNSPLLKEWLQGNPVGIEDGLRHDKWCAMMYPRLRLLHELLADTGSFWMTLDDNEVHRARAILDEIFGEANFVTQVEWQKRYTRSNNTNDFTSVIDHVVVYQKTALFEVNLVPRSEEADARFTNADNDPRGPWKATPFLNQVAPDKRPNLCYPITNPHTGKVVEPTTKAWRNDQATYERLLSDNRLWWGVNGDRDVPDIKSFLSEVKQGLAPINFWPHDFAGNTDEANSEISEIFGSKVFDTPKPTKLLDRVLEHAIGRDALVLDSFAGSGTTAHAVLMQNSKDGGNRKFILVEGEDYADTLTAERVRRVMNGYEFTGTQREELARETITWSTFSRNNARQRLLDHVQSIENLDGPRFDRIKKTVKDGELIVTGEKDVTKRTEGLGGSFTYCTLGPAIELDALLTGESLPAFDALGAVLFHMASNAPFDADRMQMHGDGIGLLGTAAGMAVWLIYQPDIEWLKSKDAALTLERARQFAAIDPTHRHLVFAPARFVSQKLLDSEGLKVEFAPLPYALYRIERT